MKGGSYKMKKIFLLSVLFILFSNPVFAHVGEDEYGHHMMGEMMYNNYTFGIFGFLISTLVVITLMLVIYWLIQQITKNK